MTHKTLLMFVLIWLSSCSARQKEITNRTIILDYNDAEVAFFINTSNATNVLSAVIILRHDDIAPLKPTIAPSIRFYYNSGRSQLKTLADVLRIEGLGAESGVREPIRLTPEQVYGWVTVGYTMTALRKGHFDIRSVEKSKVGSLINSFEVRLMALCGDDWLTIGSLNGIYYVK